MPDRNNVSQHFCECGLLTSENKNVVIHLVFQVHTVSVQNDTRTPHRQKKRPSIDEGLLACVPDLEKLLRGCRTNQTRVDETGEAHARNVSAFAVESVKVPDGLGRRRKVVREETTCNMLHGHVNLKQILQSKDQAHPVAPSEEHACVMTHHRCPCQKCP